MKIKQLLILSAAALSLGACGEHTHSFGDAWKSDNTSHWHECECGEKSGKADHLDTNADGKCDTCNHEMEVPAPTGTEVTKDEWMASIGMEKPFLFADNYKFNMLGKMNGVDFAEENFYADGNKFKDEPVKAPNGEELGTESYYSFENSKYVAYQFTGGKWSTHETSSTPIHSIIQTSLAPFGNPDLFTYDETSMSYKCETTTMGVTFTNLEIKFVEKKITKTTFTAQGADYICSLTYGGQTVTLPDISQPSVNEVTSSEWVAAFGLNKPYYIADNYKMDIEMNAGGQTMASTIWVDGLKLKTVQTQGVADETYYNEIVDGQKYQYQFDEQTSKWTKIDTTRSIADDFANYLEPFGANYSSFTYDNVANAYKCTSLSFGGHSFTNLSIKFENKQIAEISLSSVMGDEGHTPFSMTFEITYGGQTVTLPDIPQPSVNEVTSSEWEAALGLEKPFLFADNYKFNMLVKVKGVDVGEENYYADGNKLKCEPVKVPEGERLGSESYYLFENSKYIAYQFNGGKWSTYKSSYTPMHDIVQDSLAPFGNPDLFTYDETSKSYKCETTTIVAWEVTYTNLEIKFVDKKITEASFTVEGEEDYICTLTYGGQTVTLPEDIPQPSVNEVTPSEWQAAFGLDKPFLFADNYKFNTLVKMNGVDFDEYNFYVDGNKLKYEPVKAQGETLGGESYYSFENSKYIAYQFTGGKWSTQETSYTPMRGIIQATLAPFGNPDLFTYDETSMSYKCETTTMGVTFTNLEIKFVDKKITEIIFNIENYDYIYTLTYGGQTVTLPELEAWSSITYEEIKQAYNNKQNSPYNHREYEYLENNTTYRIIEDYSGTWVVDQEKSEGGITDSPLAWFEDQYNILVYESIIDQATMSIEKNEIEHKYRYIFEFQTMKQVVILDEYFNYLQCLQYNNDQLSGGMQNCVYSTVK